MLSQSKIYRGEVTHIRVGPTEHRFSYPMTFFGFQLNEIATLSKQASLFAHNRFAPLSLRDNDYLRGNNQSIQQQLEEFLPPEQPGQSTQLITSPRFFGYAFNPVNFHLRLQGEQLLAAVAEVNNTFGDRHIYPLNALTQTAASTWTATSPKDFHVSPFNDLNGEYKFTFTINSDDIYLGVDLFRQNQCVMKTWIKGTGRPLTNRSITKHALLHPFDTAVNTMPRILWQAAQLYYRKKLQVYKRPAPTSPDTLINRDHPKQATHVL